MAGVYRWLCWWLALAAAAPDPAPAPLVPTTICDVAGCNCTTQHKYWQIVNCTLDNKQVLEVVGGMLPVKTIELSVSGVGGGELVLQGHAFSALHNLQRVLVDAVAAVDVRRHAFQAAGGASVLLQVAHCDAVRLHTDAFRDMGGPLSLQVTRCAYVSVQRGCFGFLQDAAFTDIPRLELADEAFTLVNRDLGHHGAVTTIRFQRVMIPMLGRDVFKSSLAEVSLSESEVREVAGGAFSGNTIAAVNVVNSSLHRVRGSAFAERTQLDNLVFTRCRLHHIDTNAFLSAIANLTIQHTNISTLSAGAVNAIVARLVFRHNWVEAFRSGALTVRDWSRVSVDDNKFGKVSERALDLVDNGVDSELTFSNNVVRLTDTGALIALAGVPRARIFNNQFGHPCHCDIRRWLDATVGDNCSDSVAGENFCSVDQVMAQCYELTDKAMLIRNFTDAYCGDDGSVIECKTFAADANVGGNPGAVAGVEDTGGLVLGLVLGLLLLLAVCGTAVILLVHGGMWLRRKGYCVHYRADEPSTEVEDIMAAAAADQQAPHSAADMPEELTQDLLQVLRDKLEDPSTYHEAREMIERLYDHFIIEDSYTNNNRHDEETHLYEELGSAAAGTGGGTDADKAATAGPFSFLRLIEERFGLGAGAGTSMLAAEYSEPTDAEVHLYSELPSRHKEDRQNEINEELQARTPSPAYLASRPLPTTPGTSTQC